MVIRSMDKQKASAIGPAWDGGCHSGVVREALTEKVTFN